jgi:hypothetical protein
MKKINEHSTEVLKKELKEVKERYNKLIEIITKLAAYFDNSIGVPEEKKEDLKKALNGAVECPTTAESIVVEDLPKGDTKKALEPKEEPKNTVKVER